MRLDARALGTAASRRSDDVIRHHLSPAFSSALPCVSVSLDLDELGRPSAARDLHPIGSATHEE